MRLFVHLLLRVGGTLSLLVLALIGLNRLLFDPGQIVFAGANDLCGGRFCSDVYTIDLAQMTTRRLSEHALEGIDYWTWSPSGHYLVGSRYRRLGIIEYVAVEVSTGVLTVQPVNLALGQPQQRSPHWRWSPDGQQLAITANCNNFFLASEDALMIFDTQNRTFKPVPTQMQCAQNPHWSPAGDQLAFMGFQPHDYGLYAIHRTGENLRRLTDTSAYYSVLSWDGDQIIGLRQQIDSRSAASSELYAVAAAGTDFRVLADLPAPLGRITPAPDGRLVAFTEDEDCAVWPCNAHEAIYVFDLDRGVSRQLVDADNYHQGLRWSPDNRYLLYEVPVDAFEVGLHVVEIATGSQWQLAQAALRNHGAHWSPDSQRVAYQRVISGQPPRVYISDVVTREQVVLPVSSLDLGASRLQWSPDSRWLALQETGSGGPQCRRGISLCNDIYLMDIDRALVFNLTRHRFNIQQFLWQS